MEPCRYKWKRFWCQPDARINLSDSGFLVNPEAEHGQLMNPDVLAFESIANTPCLILLGEPGVGKSTAIEDETSRTKVVCEASGDDLLSVDLRSYQTDQRLHNHVFESPTVNKWRSGTHRLHLFLDSMDECLLRIDNIGAVLINEFKDLSVARLSVRIACRTADWPLGLTSQLQKLWGKDNAKVYELVPLRRIDVETAAQQNDLPPSDFMNEVLRRQAVPLAIKPVTLQFLLNTYKKRHGFPATQAELYGEGCRLLCEETRDEKRQTNLTADERLAVAARIAATTVFCNRYAIWTDIDQGDVPEEDVPLRQLTGGEVTAQGAKVAVSINGARQALNTGLFSSRGLPRIGWAHQTYSEFLAARFLIDNGFSADRMVSLLVHPGGKIVPQLHETAAWLASMLPEIFRRMMDLEPELLLRSDAATADAKDRMQLTENLLRLFAEGQLLDIDFSLRSRYQKLCHPRLGEQLGPYVRDKGKGLVVRRVAITMAEACDALSLSDDLVAVSLDETDLHDVRVTAAFAVVRMGDDNAKSALRPLALGTAGPDPDDELKGCGLMCTWPSLLRAPELFEALTPRKRSNLFGMYHRFLTRDIAKDLDPNDLPVAIRWVAERREHGDPISPFQKIADSIAAKALDYLEAPEVLEALATAIGASLSIESYPPYGRQESEFKRKLEQNDSKRRRLFLSVLPLAPPSPTWTFLLLEGSLILPHDFLWLLDQLVKTKAYSDQRTLVDLIIRMFDQRDPDQLDALLQSSKRHELLASEVRWVLNPVILDSPQGEEMKRHWAQMNQRSVDAQGPPLLDPPPDKRIATLLQRFEEGDLDAFWRLNLDLTLEPNSTRYGDEFESDITAQPGWKRSDPATRQRIVDAVKLYLPKYEPPAPAGWIKSNIFPRPCLAGYRALSLLLREAPDDIDALPQACWRKWAPMTLAYQLYGNNVVGEVHQSLTRLAYKNAPDTILGTLGSLIDKENEAHGVIFVLERLVSIWDRALASAF